LWVITTPYRLLANEYVKVQMSQATRPWTIFSNHGIVLLHVAANPNITLRQLSDTLSITERQVFRILKDLAVADMIQVKRQGRCNCYVINPEAHLRHPTLSHIPLQRIITTVVPELTDRSEAPAKCPTET
jgi:hypothetical protein